MTLKRNWIIKNIIQNAFHFVSDQDQNNPRHYFGWASSFRGSGLKERINRPVFIYHDDGRNTINKKRVTVHHTINEKNHYPSSKIGELRRTYTYVELECTHSQLHFIIPLSKREIWKSHPHLAKLGVLKGSEDCRIPGFPSSFTYVLFEWDISEILS